MIVLENYHDISLENMIASYEAGMICGKQKSYDLFKKEDLIMLSSLVDFRITKALTAKLCRME